MGGASSYLAMLAICGFLSAAWMATKISKFAGVSSIVLEIATGVILGPSVLGLMSDEYAVCEHKRPGGCVVPPDFLHSLDQGHPIGQDLARIVSMDYCTRSDYEHHDEGHSDHGDNHAAGGVDDEGDAHGGAGSHDDHSTDGEHIDHNGHGEGHDDGLVLEPSFDDSTGTATAAPSATANPFASTAAATTLAPLDFSDIGNDDEVVSELPSPWIGQLDDPGRRRLSVERLDRRLSGGGGDYATYEECIEKSCQSDVSHHCGLTPDVFTLIGHAGVALMIFESGMHFDFEKATVVGPKACAVAVFGTILPLITGSILTVLYGKPLVPDAVSVGTALAPTSVGIALRLLGEAGVLQYDFGQAIITAAFVDDILSLVLFNILFSLRGDFDVMATVVNPIIGIVFMGIAMALAVKFWPRAINEYILPRLPQRPGERKVSIEDETIFLVMMGLLLLYGTITHFLGTHLWGCFIAGMSFACVDKPGHKGHVHHVWVRQTKRMTSWMIRIFFACTVAFSIPVSKLLSFDAFWKGSIMGIGPCILTKVLCAPFMGNARFVIGWAMVGRAEFAYLIAQMAAAGSMIDEDTFSITIWALLYATIFAPFMFRLVLNRYIESEGIEAEKDPHFGESEEEDEEEDDDVGILGAGRMEDAHMGYGHETKKRVDFDVDLEQRPAIYGKELEDLDKVILEEVSDNEKTRYQKERTGGWDPDDLPDFDSPEGVGRQTGSPPQQRTVRRFWAGRAPAKKVDRTNGFLCCLLFKKVVVNN